MTSRGVAYQLWAAIEDERLNRGWTAVKMAEEIGLPRGTISRMETSSVKPRVSTVHAAADALKRLGVDIDRVRAEQMAGLRPASVGEGGRMSVREAILADPDYTEEEREHMLRLVDLIHRARRRQAQGDNGNHRQSA